MKKLFKKHENRLLIIVVVVMIIVFIILSIVNLFKQDKNDDREGDNYLSTQTNFNTASTKIDNPQAASYIAPDLPTLKDNDKIFGSADAPLKIFVYEDYTNIFSASLADTLEKIKAEAGNKLAVVIRSYFKDAPLALKASAAVDCAGEQGKWVQMRALLFARAKNHQSLTPDFSSYIKQLNLNGEEFAVCLTNAEKSGKIEKSAAEAESYMVQGTPTIFVGDEMILGARPYENFIDSNGDQIEGLKTIVDKKLLIENK